MINVAVFTGTRAEYGLLYWLMKDIQRDADLNLQMIVSGTHLSPEFGYTYHQIEADGFQADEKIEMVLSSNSPVGVAKSMGLGIIGFTDALDRLRPDILVVLGDRFEALSIAQTAMILRIPILHLHGGEVTEGALDESIRHAITKLSYLHGTSNEEHRQRVIQLGESPDRVCNVGALGLDHLNRLKLMSKEELSNSLEFKLDKPYFVVTYHPATMADKSPSDNFKQLLMALDEFLEYQIVLTYPNADDGGREIITLIENYADRYPGRVIAIPSLGHLRYLSALKYASSVIGNSSSGIIEVPSFGIPTINIGDRQKGRIAADSVIHASIDKSSITDAIELGLLNLKSSAYKNVCNPYGQGEASSQVIKMIKSLNSRPIKSFYDLR